MNKIAAIFPGQGSQSIGMLKELAADYPVVEEVFAEASEVLGYNLWQLVQEGDKEELNQTTVTQPAMLAAGVAVWKVWQQQNGQNPDLVAGHSLGEYTALVTAEALEFADAIKLVAERARLMQEAVPVGVGAMAAILGLDDAAVLEVCDKSGAEAVNFNSPGQVVIAGKKEAVEDAMVKAKEAGAKRALLLPVSVPSHSSLMKSAADKLEKYMDNIAFSNAKIPLVNNVSAEIVSSVSEIKSGLVQQLFNPVRWVASVQKMADEEITIALELGPGKVLTGLNKRIDKRVTTLAVFNKAGVDDSLEKVNG